MPKILINDIHMHYQCRGKDQGPRLLMIMGWTANMDWWPESLLQRLEKHYSLILFDNRGAGRTSGSKGCYGMDLFAKDAVGLLDALDAGQVHVFGVSMGGMIAQQMAISYPDRVNKLVLGCTTCGFKNGRAVSWQSFLYSPLYALRFPPSFNRWLLSLTISRYCQNRPETRDFVRRINIAPMKRKEKWKQFYAIHRFQSHPALKTVKCPVLIMTGTRDLMVPHRNADILARQIPHAKVVRFPGASHAFVGDCPEAVYKEIDAFLRPNNT